MTMNVKYNHPPRRLPQRTTVVSSFQEHVGHPPNSPFIQAAMRGRFRVEMRWWREASAGRHEVML